MSDKSIVGNKEWCTFSELNIPAVKARVDSGAKTSALHAVNISPFDKQGTTWVRFEVHPIQNNETTIIHCEAEVIDSRVIKSSSGTTEQRYVIKSELTLDGHQWDIEVTLTNRDSMGFRMLLGREAMVGRIIVDPEESYVCGKITKKQLLQLYTQ